MICRDAETLCLSSNHDGVAGTASRAGKKTRERRTLSIAFAIAATTALPIASAEAHGWQIYAPYAPQGYDAYAPHFAHHPLARSVPVFGGLTYFNARERIAASRH